MSPSIRANQGEVTTANNLPPYLYWISTLIACGTLLPAVYVACLMFGSYILTPTTNHTRNIEGTPSDLGTRETKEEDGAMGLETTEGLKEKVHVTSGAEGVRKARLTRTRRA